MSSVTENNKRIAKNTLFLYVRLLFSIIVSLYTSRVVLATLGADDFGLNTVVVSAVTIFMFLNASMAGATSRFLTFELGRQDYEKLKKTFSASLTIHFIIAGIILLLGETVGLWYLENKMVIPAERMIAARWVFHLSLLSAMITITQIPYNASIIAHEKMNVYAYIEITKTCLLLGAVYLLVIGNIDKLILYAILTLCVSIFVTFIYRIYCIKHFSECRYRFEWNKKLIIPMLAFSGWDLFANATNSIKSQGINIILNLFFVTAVNAAYAIALQVNAAVSNLSSHFTLATKPQLIKYYAENRILEMERLMTNASKFSFLLLAAFCVPIMLEIPFVLSIWLGNVPPYANILCRLYLVITLLTSVQFIMNSVIHTTGKMKWFSLSCSIINLATPVLSYLYFRFVGRVVYTPLLIYIAAIIMKEGLLLFLINKSIAEFSIKRYLKGFLPVCLLVIVFAMAIPLFVFFTMNEGWGRFISVILLSLSLTVGFTFLFALNKEMKKKIINTLTQKLHIR